MSETTRSRGDERAIPRPSPPPLRRPGTGGRSDDVRPAPDDPLESALKRVLPDGVVARLASGSMWEEELPPEEAACVRDAVPKRRREFAAGRAAARQALAELGFGDAVLPPDDDRVPEWPEGVVGSISHRGDRCAAVVTDDPSVVGLGLDLELAEPLEGHLVSRVCTPREREWGRLAVTGLEPSSLFKIVFSAKETVYKCCYPATRRPLEFHDVEVTPHPPTGSFVADIHPSGQSNGSAPSLPSRLRGRYAMADGLVITAAAWTRG